MIKFILVVTIFVALSFGASLSDLEDGVEDWDLEANKENLQVVMEDEEIVKTHIQKIPRKGNENLVRHQRDTEKETGVKEKKRQQKDVEKDLMSSPSDETRHHELPKKVKGAKSRKPKTSKKPKQNQGSDAQQTRKERKGGRKDKTRKPKENKNRPESRQKKGRKGITQQQQPRETV